MGSASHATDGPPTSGPAGPSIANFVAIDGPAGLWQPWMVRADRLWRGTTCGVTGPLLIVFWQAGSYEDL